MATKQQVTLRFRDEYMRASKKDRGRILDEMCSVLTIGRSTARRGSPRPDAANRRTGGAAEAVFVAVARAAGPSVADDGFAVREVPQGEAAPMDADAARAWRARRLGRVRIPGAGADERGHDGPVPQEDAGRGTTQGRLHDQARRGVAAQLDHGTGSVQRQARWCRPTITPVPFRNNTRYSNLQIITVCRSGRRGSSTRRI